METVPPYAALGYDWTDLRALWDDLARGAGAPEFGPGVALEYLVLRSFELSGAEVRWPYEVRMKEAVVEQIDGAVYADGLSCLVECKDTAAPVDVGVIAKLRNQLLRRPAGVVGLLFSRRGYTDSAVVLARFTAPQVILLWYPAEIRRLLETEDAVGLLRRKYRGCVEEGAADYRVIEEGMS